MFLYDTFTVERIYSNIGEGKRRNNNVYGTKVSWTLNMSLRSFMLTYRERGTSENKEIKSETKGSGGDIIQENVVLIT